MNTRQELARLIEGWLDDAPYGASPRQLSTYLADKFQRVEIEMEESEARLWDEYRGEWVAVIKISHPLGLVGIDSTRSPVVD